MNSVCLLEALAESVIAPWQYEYIVADVSTMDSLLSRLATIPPRQRLMYSNHGRKNALPSDKMLAYNKHQRKSYLHIKNLYSRGGSM